jgi:hypothetical protein
VSEPCILQPKDSFPPRLRAGDEHDWTVQTRLPQGTFVFYVLTGVVNNVPVRYVVAQPGGTPGAYTGGTAVDANGVASFTLATTVTGKYLPGRYQWVCFALDPVTGRRDELAQGEIRIEPDPLATVPADPRSRNERLLASIRLVLDGKALDDTQMYKIGNRELTKMPVKDLLYWEGVTEAAVRKERIRRGERVGRKTPGIRFGGVL